MARGRMISKSLGSSRKYHALLDAAGKLGEFAQALYPLLITNADDFGRLPGDAFTVKHSVFPTSPRRESDFSKVLDAMEKVGLIDYYESNGSTYIQIENFGREQPGLKKLSGRAYPAPPGMLEASERDIEAHVCGCLASGSLSLGAAIVSIERQVRVRSSYLDIVVKTSDGRTFVFEVKRHSVTNRAIAQVLAYQCLLDAEKTWAVVVGYGLAANVVPSQCDAVILVYDDQLRFSRVSSSVTQCQITLNHTDNVSACQVLREVKGTEVNGTEESTTPLPPASGGVRPFRRRRRNGDLYVGANGSAAPAQVSEAVLLRDKLNEAIRKRDTVLQTKRNDPERFKRHQLASRLSGIEKEIRELESQLSSMKRAQIG